MAEERRSRQRQRGEGVVREVGENGLRMVHVGGYKYESRGNRGLCWRAKH